MKSGHHAIAAARDLRAALTALHDALASLRLDGVLAAEPTLSLALTAATSGQAARVPAPIDSAEAAALRTELIAARLALARCQALGAALEDFCRGRALSMATYDASGAGVGLPARPAIDRRV